MNQQERSERARRHLLESAEVKRQSAQVCIGGIATTLIRVPSADTGHIQKAHIAIAHAFCDLVERILYSPYPATAGGQG